MRLQINREAPRATGAHVHHGDRGRSLRRTTVQGSKTRAPEIRTTSLMAVVVGHAIKMTAANTTPSPCPRFQEVRVPVITACCPMAASLTDAALEMV